MSYNESFIKKAELLKTQRILVNVGHSFVLTTVVSDETTKQQQTLFMNKKLMTFFGLKDTSSSTSSKPQTKTYLIMALIIFCLVMLSSYPVILDNVKGGGFVRLISLYGVSLAFLAPITFVEITRKMKEKVVGLRDMIHPGNLIKIYINSIIFTLLNVFFVKSLEYTEFSTSVFLSNLLLMVNVIYKNFMQRTLGLSEIEVKGASWMAIGVLVFFLKNLLLGDIPRNRSSLFQQKSSVGEILAICASITGTIFYKRHYDTHSRIPKYTNIFLIVAFTVANILGLKVLDLMILKSEPITISCKHYPLII